MLNFEQTQKIYGMALTEKEFRRLSEFIHREIGVKMPHSKKTMLEGRLRKRLRNLGISNFSDYCDYVFTVEGQMNELPYMIDVVTTHKTDFFREPAHFEILVKHILPEMITVDGVGVKQRLMAWSAGCSSGEEAYTLAMVLSNFGDKFPGFQFDFLILATDISNEVLETGKRGIYAEESIHPVPMELRKKYLMRHRDPNSSNIRIVPPLRKRVRFRPLNLLDADFGMREPVDIIFYRNVMIYFDSETQERLLNNIAYHLRPGGYLFLGHSENINRMNVPLVPVYPSVYRKK